MDRPCWDALSAAAITKIRAEFHAQHISNLAWACATIGILDRPLLAALSSRAISIITSFNPQDLGNTAWAFASLGVQDVPLLNAIAAESIRKLNDSQDFQP